MFVVIYRVISTNVLLNALIERKQDNKLFFSAVKYELQANTLKYGNRKRRLPTFETV